MQKFLYILLSLAISSATVLRDSDLGEDEEKWVVGNDLHNLPQPMIGSELTTRLYHIEQQLQNFQGAVSTLQTELTALRDRVEVEREQTGASFNNLKHLLNNEYIQRRASLEDVNLSLTFLQSQLHQTENQTTLMGQIRQELCRVTPTLGLIEHLTSPVGHYQYTWQEAKQACEADGGRLAEYRELYAEYRRGLERCDCGWLADGTAWYPMHSVWPQCKNARGMHVCEEQGTYNAWCWKKLSICP
ncbi:brevican core protein-like [Branchiostoma lanceolatum]|uniref:brevican core protein-like n=1 Tax=Branchiostoma lanceolatum TaxID=7740 RepID=UPI003456B655